MVLTVDLDSYLESTRVLKRCPDVIAFQEEEYLVPLHLIVRAKLEQQDPSKGVSIHLHRGLKYYLIMEE